MALLLNALCLLLLFLNKQVYGLVNGKGLSRRPSVKTPSSQFAANNDNDKKNANKKSIQLVTKAIIPDWTCDELQAYIACPVHWPEIVASSDSVSLLETPTANTPRRQKQQALNQPMRPGETIQENFGLGLLSVEWTCRENQPGTSFRVASPNGVQGIAENCGMDFVFTSPPRSTREENPMTEIQLTMSYQPTSPIALLATPILVLDNWIALNLLLPAAVDRFPLNSFRILMGRLYGVAGVLHGADLLAGDSTLFVSQALPPYADLIPAGKLYALLWAASGPLAFFMTSWLTPARSNTTDKTTSLLSAEQIADSGLVLYGLIEVYGAWCTGNRDVFVNAAFVQLVVAAAWWYSSTKQIN